MVERLQQGQSGAAQELSQLYERGIRVYLKRHLGLERLDRLVPETLGEMVDRIRQGRMLQPLDLVGFLREVVNREQSLRERASAPTEAAEEARIRRKAKVLEKELQRCTPREREMLTRYYLLGQELTQILGEMRAGEEEFRRLKDRMRRTQVQKPPGVEVADSRKASSSGS